jgi:phosphatidylserine/phosphatidylglycerophosphate/cardiolipin synthase-like enzyme
MDIHKSLYLILISTIFILNSIMGFNAQVEVYFFPEQENEFNKTLYSHFDSLKAGEEIFVCIHSINDKKFINKLIALKNRGVGVNLIFDAMDVNLHHKCKQLSNKFLQNSIVPVVKINFAFKKKNFMHNKFVVVRDCVYTGSANYTFPINPEPDFLDNDETILVIQSPEVAKLYIDEFFDIQSNIFKNYLANFLSGNWHSENLPSWVLDLFDNIYLNYFVN